MNKIIALLLVALIGTQTIAQAATVTPRTHAIVEKLNSYGKKSAKIAADIVIAYGTLMGFALTHELAHALTAKLLVGTPINIIMGGVPNASHNNKVIYQIGGIKFYSVNPFLGFNSIKIPELTHPLKLAAISLAGPIAGAMFTASVFKLLNKYSSGFYITKTALAIPNLFEIIAVPFAKTIDLNQAAQYIQQYRNS